MLDFLFTEGFRHYVFGCTIGGFAVYFFMCRPVIKLQHNVIEELKQEIIEMRNKYG